MFHSNMVEISLSLPVSLKSVNMSLGEDYKVKRKEICTWEVEGGGEVGAAIRPRERVREEQGLAPGTGGAEQVRPCRH